MIPTVMQTQRTNSYKDIGSSGNTCLYDFPYFVRKCGWRDGSAARAVYVKAVRLSRRLEEGNSRATSQVGSVLGHRLQLPGPTHPSLRLCVSKAVSPKSPLSPVCACLWLRFCSSSSGSRKRRKTGRERSGLVQVRPGPALCLFHLVSDRTMTLSFSDSFL